MGSELTEIAYANMLTPPANDLNDLSESFYVDQSFLSQVLVLLVAARQARSSRFFVNLAHQMLSSTEGLSDRSLTLRRLLRGPLRSNTSHSAPQPPP